MEFLLLVLFIVALVLVLVAVVRRGAFRHSPSMLRSSASAPWPFYPKRPLSRPEQVLYHRLVTALPQHIILAQVQASRVLGVKKGFNFYEWNNRINRLSYDFVVCAKDSTVLAAIELDDRSHDTDMRAETDRKKAKATLDAGIRLIRWQVNSLPEHSTIQAAFGEQQPDLTSADEKPARLISTLGIQKKR